MAKEALPSFTEVVLYTFWIYLHRVTEFKTQAVRHFKVFTSLIPTTKLIVE